MLLGNLQGPAFAAARKRYEDAFTDADVRLDAAYSERRSAHSMHVKKCDDLQSKYETEISPYREALALAEAGSDDGKKRDARRNFEAASEYLGEPFIAAVAEYKAAMAPFMRKVKALESERTSALETCAAWQQKSVCDF